MYKNKEVKPMFQEFICKKCHKKLSHQPIPKTDEILYVCTICGFWFTKEVNEVLRDWK